jgi:hypothetical protein
LSQTKIYLSYLSFTEGKANLCPLPAAHHTLPFSAPLPALLLGPGQRKETGGQENPLSTRPAAWAILESPLRGNLEEKVQSASARSDDDPTLNCSILSCDNTTYPCRHLQGIIPLRKEVWPEHRRLLQSCSRQETPQVTLTPPANRPSPQPPHTREAHLLPIQPHHSLSFQKRCGEKLPLGSLLHVHINPGLTVPVL